MSVVTVAVFTPEMFTDEICRAAGIDDAPTTQHLLMVLTSQRPGGSSTKDSAAARFAELCKKMRVNVVQAHDTDMQHESASIQYLLKIPRTVIMTPGTVVTDNLIQSHFRQIQPNFTTVHSIAMTNDELSLQHLCILMTSPE